MPLRITETNIQELELPPLPRLGSLIPREMERDLHEALQDYARKALALHAQSAPASLAVAPDLLTPTIAQYVADHCVDGGSHAKVILGMAGRHASLATGGEKVPSEDVRRWENSQAVAVAHASGFAGTCWTMGPEELAHLLSVAGPQPSPEHVEVTEKRAVWVAYTNTDCTEGRGHDVPIATCAIEATALRLAREKYIQGTDGPVRELELVKVDGKWCAPTVAINVIEPTPGDLAAQAALDMKRQAVAKAKAAGLTDAELRALGI